MITICALSQVDKLCSKHNFTHIVSIGTPDSRCYGNGREKIPYSFRNFKLDNRIRLEFDDIDIAEDVFAPKEHDIQRLINFLQTIPEDANVLIHCFAGISRSTATALVLLMIKNNFNGAIAKQNLLAIRPQAIPNKLICSLADKILGLSGHNSCLEVAKEIHFVQNIRNNSLWNV